MPRRRWTLPIILGLITAILLAAVLWPAEEPTRAMAVAARDLGAGTLLTASDLAVVEMAEAQAPADAAADPAALIGQTLAVVRFAGEPVTARHLGPAVTLAPDERGLAVKVQADTGLAGLLRPGMRVGVIATLAGDDRDVYAKSTLEGLRVLYVSPDFQARPYAPAPAATTVTPGGNTSGALGVSNPPPASSPGNTGTVREGVLVLAIGTAPQPVRYEVISDTLTLAATTPMTDTVKPEPPQAAAPAPAPAPPPPLWVAPLELLAALNAQGSSFTLSLLPEDAQPFGTEGLTLSTLRPTPAAPEPKR
jgi:hypothetical protein